MEAARGRLRRQPTQQLVGLDAKPACAGTLRLRDRMRRARRIGAEDHDLFPVGDAAMFVPDEPTLADFSVADEAVERRRSLDDITAVEKLAAVGHLAKNAAGKMAITKVELHPKIVFSGTKLPAQPDLDWLHDKAHRECFIANSVTTEIAIVPAA